MSECTGRLPEVSRVYGLVTVFFIHCISHSCIYHAKLWSQNFFWSIHVVHDWQFGNHKLQTGRSPVGSSLGDNSRLGLWIVLVMTYWSFCIFKSAGFIICSATLLNTLHIGIKYEHWEFLSHQYSIHWLLYKSDQRPHCSKGHTLQNLNYFTNIFVFGPLNLLFFIKCNWNRFSIAWPTCPYAGLPILSLLSHFYLLMPKFFNYIDTPPSHHGNDPSSAHRLSLTSARNRWVANNNWQRRVQYECKFF